MSDLQPDITDLLVSARAGDREVVDRLLPRLYDDLRRMAAAQMRDGPVTIDPTGVVHEAYLRLIGQRDVRWESREHLLAIAATLIRRIVVDYARARGRKKRGGSSQPVTLTSAGLATLAPGVDTLALHQALERLAAEDRAKARVVELRFFAGLTQCEIAAVLGVSERTVERHWKFSRAWLHREIGR